MPLTGPHHQTTSSTETTNVPHENDTQREPACRIPRPHTFSQRNWDGGSSDRSQLRLLSTSKPGCMQPFILSSIIRMFLRCFLISYAISHHEQNKRDTDSHCSKRQREEKKVRYISIFISHQRIISALCALSGESSDWVSDGDESSLDIVPGARWPSHLSRMCHHFAPTVSSRFTPRNYYHSDTHKPPIYSLSDGSEGMQSNPLNGSSS